MKKNMFKKMASFLLALMLLCAMGTTAFAVDITIKDKVPSSYAAYKLLNATNAGDNYAYTLNAKYTNILKTVTGKTTQADIIAYIAALDNDGVRTFADSVYAELKTPTVTPADYTINNATVFSGVAQGYYLIVETAVGNQGDVISLVMLDTAGESNIEVETKESTPSVEKKVQDKDDSTGEVSEWQDSADYDIGDSIPYQITGTVSNEIANYKTYYYLFTDTMIHLTYNNDAHVFLVNGQAEEDITSYFTPDWNSSTKILTLTCDDLKEVEIEKEGADKIVVNGNSKIVVRYSATLDADAVIGGTGNPNTVTLTYGNNPYHEGDGQPTNTTPPDTNVVFTFGSKVNKVKADNSPLEGAGFKLYKYMAPAKDAPEGTEGSWQQVGQEITGKTTFEFKGLDAGKYKLEESTVPKGYNKEADIEFVIVAEHQETADSPTLTSLVVKNMKGEVISGENKIFTANTETGTVTTDVVNTTGTELPSTGGIGTTIFYALGGILVIAAAVLLITKKRMSNEE